MAAISATNLTKHYDDVKAVRGIDLEVAEGSIHGFVGPNGAGKTTTMEMLVGVASPTVGEASVLGAPAGSNEALERIGYAPQDPVFYESMTARAYLRYMGKVAGVDGSLADRVDELLAWVDLADAADQAIGGFSGGMARRLGLAQAMVHDPEVLILDEPTAELDPRGRASIIDALEDLADEGRSVFVSSHVLAELEQFVESVTVIDEGRIVTSGPLEEISSGATGTLLVESTDDDRLVDRLSAEPSVVRTERRSDGSGMLVGIEDEDAFATALPQLLADAEIGLYRLDSDDGLEEAFLKMIEEAGD